MGTSRCMTGVTLTGSGGRSTFGASRHPADSDATAARVSPQATRRSVMARSLAEVAPRYHPKSASGSLDSAAASVDDNALAAVAYPETPDPVENRQELRFAAGEQQQVHRKPHPPSRITRQRDAHGKLRYRSAASDSAHDAPVPVDEGRCALAVQQARNIEPRVTARLLRHRAQLGQRLHGPRIDDDGDVAGDEDLRIVPEAQLGSHGSPSPGQLDAERGDDGTRLQAGAPHQRVGGDDCP